MAVPFAALPTAGRAAGPLCGLRRQEVREKLKYRYLKTIRYIWAVIALMAFVTTAALALDSPDTRPAYVPNQLMVKFAPTASSADRISAVEAIGGKVVSTIARDNTSLIQLEPSRGITVEAAVTRARSIQAISVAEPNYYRYIQAIPNDPRWNDLWGMRMINCPKAWDVTKGKADVIVAVLDNGFRKTHEDLQERLLQGYDFGDNDDDVSPDPTDESGSHGTHVAGTIGAQGNNGKGVVGVCWDNVKILPVKIEQTGFGLSTFAEIQGLDYAMQQGAQVVNMSFGGYWSSILEHDKIKELAAAGIILVASAGNDATSMAAYPASYDECISVSALNKNEEPAIYTNYGPTIDIAAPGGEGPENSPDCIWSTGWKPGDEDASYYAWQGTSMAAPHVAGACGLLLSAGVPPSRVPGLLFRAARAPAVGVLDPIYYGHGVLDIYNAMRTTAELEIISPNEGEVLDTTTPLIKISTYLINRDTIKFYLDYPDANRDGTPDDLTQNIVFEGTMIDTDPKAVWDPNTNSLTLTWPSAGQQPLEPGTHTLCVMAEPAAQAQGATVKDWLVFFVQPHVISAGRHLFSIPYPLSPDVTPYQLFGNNSFRIARYIPSRNSYAKINYPNEPDDMSAWFGTGIHPHGETVDTPPSGLGFWVEVTSDTPVVVNGVADKSKAYDITLTRGASGWNMIGNPFPFPVPWESVKVYYQGKTLTLKDAISAGWIRSAIYRYTKSGYTFQTPPDAVLIPWEGHWVRILPDNPEKANDSMVLIIPPVSSGAIVETPRSRAVSTADSWSLRLEARAGDIVDFQNIIGVNSRAADGRDMLDIEKPPVLDGYVQLSFVHRDWGNASGRYATDYRPNIGTGKSWDFEVATDLPNKDISITWPDVSSVPKQYNLVLEDLDNGTKTYIRTRSAYSFNSGAKPGIRRFALHVEPANRSPLLVSGVTVSRTKGSSVSISYNISRDARVEVWVRDGNNKLVRILDGNTTRAAGLNTVHWDCSLSNGKQAPGGLYMAEIIATGPDGEVVKTVKPILVR